MNTPLIRKARYLLLSAFVLFTSTACFNGDDGLPILSNLFNNRLVVILKGTYATDRPLEFAEINSNRIFNDPDDNTAFVRNPVDNGCIPYVQPDCVPTYSDLPIFIDIGEIRLSSKNFGDVELNLVDSSESSEEFWDVVSDERQVYCNQLYSIDFSEDACFRTGGLINFVEFMNGTGALYPSRDIGAEVYYHAGVFVRAFATGWGFAAGALAEDSFDNKDIIGSNVIPLLNYDPNTDAVNQQLLAPDWFPLHHTVVFGQETTLVKDFYYNAVVLEIRSNIKENLMMHSFQNANGDNQVVVTMSDWRRNHDDNFADLGLNMGGNVLTRARMFYPDVVNTMVIDGGVASNRHYYSVYITNEDAKDDNLPLASTPVRNGAANELTNLMAQPYTLQCRYDCNYDGYPELVLNSSQQINVGPGPGFVFVNQPCGCGIDAATVAANSCTANPGCY